MAGFSSEDRARRRAELGRVIRDARTALEMSQAQLKDALNTELDDEHQSVGQTSISQWERGTAAPYSERWPAIETVLGLEPGTLASIYHDDGDMGEDGLGIPPSWFAKLAQLPPKKRAEFVSITDGILNSMRKKVG